MKDTQQHLLIEDLDYCNTVGNETEDIVGGDNFWDGIRNGIETKWNAIITTTEGTATGQTIVDVATPTHWHIIRRWLR